MIERAMRKRQRPLFPSPFFFSPFNWTRRLCSLAAAVLFFFPRERDSVDPFLLSEQERDREIVFESPQRCWQLDAADDLESSFSVRRRRRLDGRRQRPKKLTFFSLKNKQTNKQTKRRVATSG